MAKLPSLSAHLERLGPFPVTGDVPSARDAWRAHRREHGYKTLGAPILTPPEAQAKLRKGSVPLYSLTLAPASTSGVWNLCQWSTSACETACVMWTGGKGRLASVRDARTVRTLFLGSYPAETILLVAEELRTAVARFGRIGFRPNAASDIRWERIAPDLFGIDGVTFYDYTKAPISQRGTLGGAYRLVKSVSERDRSARDALEYLRAGGNAAVVFDVRKGHPLPDTWQGFPVVDGDETDARFSDPAGTVVGLRAKGDGRGMAGGFVKPNAST